MSKTFLDQLLSLPDLEGPVVSPDGSHVAWTWKYIGPAADVFMAPTDGSQAPVRLTESSNYTSVVSWAPDSTAIIVGQDNQGDERTRLFRVELAAHRRMKPLTEANPQYYISGGQLHPNGRWLIYGANLDVQTGEEIEATWIYRRDLVNGEQKILARPKKATDYPPDLNPQGTYVVYGRNDLDPSGQQIWLVDIDGKQDREILNFGPKVKVHASWFPDGKHLLFLTEAQTYRKLGVYDIDDGSTRWLIDDPSRNIEEAYIPRNSDKVVVIEVKDARSNASLLDPAKGTELKLDTPNLIPLAPSKDGKWTCLYYNSRFPMDVMECRPDDLTGQAPLTPNHSNTKSLTRVWEHTDLTPEQLAQAEDFQWNSTDGMPIHGWLYRAKNPTGSIIFIHGGPTGHSEDELSREIQYFVSQGFNVLDPNYRGSTGYGLSFQEAIKKDGWGGREQEDIKSGIQALFDAGIAHGGKVGVTGTSYGGYSSWFAITHLPPVMVAAAAPICGMTDLVVDYETTRPDLRPYSEEMMGGSPDQVPDRFRERSPITYVSNIKGKLLIVQGLRDPNVTPQNVKDVEVALKKQHIPYEVLSFADEGHGIHRPKNQKVLYEKLSQFFRLAFTESSKPAPARSAGTLP